MAFAGVYSTACSFIDVVFFVTGRLNTASDLLAINHMAWANRNAYESGLCKHKIASANEYTFLKLFNSLIILFHMYI